MSRISNKGYRSHPWDKRYATDRPRIELCHCGQPAVKSEFSPNMDGYCQNCTDVRCDAYPGECPNRQP